MIKITNPSLANIIKGKKLISLSCVESIPALKWHGETENEEIVFKYVFPYWFVGLGDSKIRAEMNFTHLGDSVTSNIEILASILGFELPEKFTEN